MKNSSLRHSRRLRRGSALFTTFGVLAIIAIGAGVYIDFATQTMRESNRSTNDVLVTNLVEAGVQSILRDVWRTFKVDQHFETIDPIYNNASATQPKGTLSGRLGIRGGSFGAGVVSYQSPDMYTRNVLVRSVGWLDVNGNGAMNEGEPRKTVDVAVSFSLLRSKVFDYTYFVNNYGWMYGFGSTTLIVNGDMRANGNFDFQGGNPTVNGSIFASVNDKLDPRAAGLINQAPVKMTDSQYLTASQGTAGMPERWRQAYNSSRHGASGSTQLEDWRDLVFESDGTMMNGRPFGAALYDSTGANAWTKTTDNGAITKTLLDTAPTSELIMPNLSDINRYVARSQAYRNPKGSYRDGSANPNAGQPAYVEVWNSTTNTYQRLSTDGVISGSAVLVGTEARPIRIHGPVTALQDVVIKGWVQGQGTIYTGRNVHIVGSLRYKNPPDFRGNNPDAVENQNEQRDILGLAASGSIIMGNPGQFQNPYPLMYMTPPFTKGRYDEAGNYIPPFNATQVDGTGRMRYQSVVSQTTINSLSEPVNQIDAIMYTNNVGGGQVGVSGSGVTINGTLISKDEAMVVYSLPLRMNYDNRIRERGATSQPLIDIDLPRSPTLARNTWQNWGYSENGNSVKVGREKLQNGIGTGRGLGALSSGTPVVNLPITDN